MKPGLRERSIGMDIIGKIDSQWEEIKRAQIAHEARWDILWEEAAGDVEAGLELKMEQKLHQGDILPKIEALLKSIKELRKQEFILGDED